MQNNRNYLPQPAALGQRWWPLVATLLLLFALFLMAMAGSVYASGNSITIPDSDGDVGVRNSLLLDASGNPVVVYQDATNWPGTPARLKVLHCNDPNCAGDDESIVDLGIETSLNWLFSFVLDSNGYPVIGYLDWSQSPRVRVIHCNDPNCAGGDESNSGVFDVVGASIVELTLDGSGYPVMAVNWGQAGSDDFLHVIHCNDPDCAGGDESITAPIPAMSASFEYSIVLDGDGYPVIAMGDGYRAVDDGLRLLHCNDPNCAGNDESFTTLDTLPSFFVNLALDSSGNPVIAYTSVGSFVIHCNDPNCAGGDESINQVPVLSTGLILDENGYPVVSAGNIEGLSVLRCNDADCAGGDESLTMPDSGRFGLTSIALDSNSYPVVSYYDTVDDDLRLLHCGTPTCFKEPATPTPTGTATAVPTDTPMPTATPTATPVPTDVELTSFDGGPSGSAWPWAALALLGLGGTVVALHRRFANM